MLRRCVAPGTASSTSRCPTPHASRSCPPSGVHASVQPAFDAWWGGPRGMYAERVGAARAPGDEPVRPPRGRGRPARPGLGLAGDAVRPLGRDPGLRLPPGAGPPASARAPPSWHTPAERGALPGSTTTGVLAPGAPATLRGLGRRANWSSRPPTPGSRHGARTRDRAPRACRTSRRATTCRTCLRTVVSGRTVFALSDPVSRPGLPIRSSGANTRTWPAVARCTGQRSAPARCCRTGSAPSHGRRRSWPRCPGGRAGRRRRPCRWSPKSATMWSRLSHGGLRILSGCRPSARASVPDPVGVEEGQPEAAPREAVGTHQALPVLAAGRRRTGPRGRRVRSVSCPQFCANSAGTGADVVHRPARSAVLAVIALCHRRITVQTANLTECLHVKHPVLELDPQVVRTARRLARKAGAPVVKLARTHTTVSVERALLRMSGLSGADAERVPWVNHLARRRPRRRRDRARGRAARVGRPAAR